MLFTVFAFVVLLGTVYPLLVEALQDRRTVVGAPYFDRLSMPIGIALLFMMAVAPVLPWRKASTELLRDRLFWPAWCGAGALALAVVVGAEGWAPLVAFGLAGFAAGAALRQVVLATRRQGWRGLVGRANGGMIVHLGVIMIAVALAASNSYTHSATIPLPVGEVRAWGGHTFELVRITQEVDDRASVVRAEVLLDGDKIYAPAITKYLRLGTDIATPSVRTGLTNDVYLTIAPSAVAPVPTDREVTLRVFVKPMVLWLWIGGAVMAIGTILAAFPGGGAGGRPNRCRRRSHRPPSRSRSRSLGHVVPRGGADDRDRGGPMATAAGRVAPFVALAVAVVLAGLFVVLAGADGAGNETADTPLLDRPAPAATRRVRGRHGVRPLASQGQLGGAQLLHVELRAVPARAP